jgi:aspartate 1-decarboxylase
LEIKKTHVERKSPQISLARLSDYMAASEQGKRSIAVSCKYQPIARLIQYNDAKAIISNYIRDENRKVEDLKEKLAVLKGKICD